MAATVLLGTFFAILLAVYYLQKWYRTRMELPGPRGLPIFGNMFQIDALHPHESVDQWAKEFGDIYSINLLGRDRVILSSDHIIRYALITNTEAFTGRPASTRVTDFMYKGGFSLINLSVDKRWKKTKKLLLNAMKIYGNGLRNVEQLTRISSEEMVEEVKRHIGQKFDVKDLLQVTVIKILAQLMFANDFNQDEMQILMEQERKILLLCMPGGDGTELDILPWLRHFRRSYMKKMDAFINEQSKVFEPAINKRKGESHGIKDCIVDHILQRNNNTDSDDEMFSDLDIRTLSCDILTAGTGTVTSALYSMIALCVTKPEVQKRIQAEIDDVIGSRVPQFADKTNMPYTNAAILEILRYTSHVPLSIPHKTTTETVLDGYVIPKNTEIWFNLWSLHHDERYWKEPWEYQPERFLTLDGVLISPDHENRQRMLAFGAGRRGCLGEQLAKTWMFVLLTSLLQHFTLEAEDEDHPPVTNPRQFESGLILYPPNYKLKFTTRNVSGIME